MDRKSNKKRSVTMEIDEAIIPIVIASTPVVIAKTVWWVDLD